MSRSTLSLVILAFTLVSCVLAFPNTLYVIRNAEVPSLGRPGLTTVGKTRATSCLPTFFATSNIGLIITCKRDVNTTACATAIDTITPLATALKVPVDSTCDTINSTETCVNDLLANFAKSSTKSVLISWDKDYLDDLFDEFDFEEDAPDFPEEYPDIVFTFRNNVFVTQASQNCANIDGSAAGTPGATANAAAKLSTPSVTSSDSLTGDSLGSNNIIPDISDTTDGADSLSSPEPDATTETTNITTETTAAAEAPSSTGASLFFTTTFTEPEPTPTLLIAKRMRRMHRRSALRL
ncbi:hypothetical protein BDQ12DRAFT_729265 [Crucibulum laeve]|uniref:Uncharacterized protein n=1 Tax=Crucibulum laeve TaxID=68775 RepID=A0A5C3LIP1_9AGAR|nr:hypothetical protein BDQ12DRAFT_729265 [Crucibulum laeve]